MLVQPQFRVFGRSRILFDAELIDDPSPALFDPSSYEQENILTNTVEGRGSNFFISSGNHAWVLRHYRRGGLVGKVNRDRYLIAGASRSRPWREWRLLALLHGEGFPVPRPVAAHYLPGLLTYRADLITEELPGVTPLSAYLSLHALSPELWGSLGKMLRRFHLRGVFHADLNAHNIMLGPEEFSLLDFDRGELRSSGRWQQANLERLHRSLIKLKSQRAGFAFGTTEWLHLLHGYHAQQG